MQISGVGAGVSPYMFQQRRGVAQTQPFANLIAAPAASEIVKTDTVTPSGSSGISYAAIETNFDAWSRQRRADGASDDYMNRVDAARTTYLDIVRKAESSGGFADPIAFVRSLDANQLQVLQTTNSLADPIDMASLTREGALNLLLPRTMAQDVDGDGITMVGKANTLVFPPSSAPQAVKDAWTKTTEGMAPVMRMHLQMSMHLADNAKRAEGGVSSTDYNALVNRAIGGAELSRRFLRADQLAFADKVLDGLRLLRSNLSTNVT
ncbi:hypothetical protein [Sphingomonas fuzhouensis]|uniref:hypothetical protein n=1 Tax=Sphingomonas fuzhouensis TaxID=3106033 RepID=UPI002AFFABCF|nr:hypothetical protein [Sphingomonas sp. SGZ-02]